MKKKQNNKKQKQWLKLINTNPIQHKLWSNLLLWNNWGGHVGKNKQIIFQTTKIQNINIKSKQQSISEYLQQELTEKQTKEKETDSFISLGWHFWLKLFNRLLCKIYESTS